MHKANFWTLQNYPSERLLIREVKNCVVTRSLFVMTAKGVSRSCLFENLPLKKELQMNLAGFLSVLKNRSYSFSDDKKYFFIFNPWARGYFHWLTEVAIKPLLFEKELREGTILVPENTPGFMLEFFELFGFHNLKTLRANVFFKKLNVVTNPHTNHYNKDHIALLRERVLERTSAASEKKRRKIYVSRKYSRARKIVNEDEVLGHLKQEGFECVHLDNMPFLEQVEMFRNCDTLVSIHGAALTNSIFMPGGSRIIEIYPRIQNEKELSACYYRLCNALDQKHFYLFCERENAHSKMRLDLDNLFVEIAELEKLLSAIDSPVNEAGRI